MQCGGGTHKKFSETGDSVITVTKGDMDIGRQLTTFVQMSQFTLMHMVKILSHGVGFNMQNFSNQLTASLW